MILLAHGGVVNVAVGSWSGWRGLACMSQRVAKRAGARGREDKARADSGAQAY